MLRGNRHFNAFLQNHYNKHGEDDLYFSVVELCSDDKLIEREIHWIKIYRDSGESFNVSEGGNLKDYVSKKYSFENLITKEKMENVSIVDFCRKTGADRSGCYKLIKNKIRMTKGWTILGRPIRKKLKSLNPKYKTTKIEIKHIKTGECYTFGSQKKASEALNAYQGSISNLYNGKIRSLKGYILKKNESLDVLFSKRQKPFGIKHPLFGAYNGRVQRDFCLKYGVSATSLSNLLSNKIKQAKGWTLA